MSSIVVLGGGICGVTTAMMLARDGHEVTVLERDPEELPATVDDAWESWDRRGVGQFRQSHHLHPRVRHILDEDLPDVRDALGDAGAFHHDMVANLTPLITDREPRPGDDRFWTYTARRTTAEYVFARAAADEPGVTIERGVRASGFVTGASVVDGVPNVIGVRTVDGRELFADLVVDAMGRRSSAPEWLQEAGGRAPHEDVEDCGFTYYTRFFEGDVLPVAIGPMAMSVGTISILTLPGDNTTWSVTVWCASGDQPLKALRHAEVFDRVVRSLPLQAHWIDGKAMTDVLAMSGTVDRYRRFVVDDQPVATGMLAVADAWACTNPSAGRGIATGVGHAARLRDVVRESLDDPERLVREFDAVTEAEFAPWYWSQIHSDRRRYAEMDALREGREPPPPLTDEFSQKEDVFWRAMAFDADLFRAAMEIVGAITLPSQVFERSELIDKARAIVAEQPGFDMPGPGRADLLALLD